MTVAGLRSAQAVIDGARAAVDRLDATRQPQENAADLIEAWNAAEAALLALVGVATGSSNALIREARQRNLLSLDDAHALLEFSAAAERARDPAYRPNDQDFAATRAGYHLLAGVLDGAPAPVAGTAPLSAPGTAPPSAAHTPAPIAASAAGPVPESTPIPASSGSLLAKSVVAVAVLAILGGGVYYAVRLGGRGGHLARGIAAYASGDRAAARTEFEAAATADPKSATAHIYLGRIAREAGDPVAAGRELDSAVTLDPENALALREMAAHLLALGNFDLARRFYVRAVSRDPTDRVALGFLACALSRLGRRDEAQRFLDRAGPGEWSGCIVAGTTPPAASR